MLHYRCLTPFHEPPSDYVILSARLVVTEAVKSMFYLYGPPKKMPPCMVWAEGEKSDDLTDLREDIQECLLQEIRYRPEGRGFTPHITLARIREWEFRKIEPEERPEIEENIDLTFTVESIDVMESELKRGGPVYSIIESHNLA